MKTNNPKEYIAPEIKVVEVIVEKGFAITAYVINKRFGDDGIENHVVDTPGSWEW